MDSVSIMMVLQSLLHRHEEFFQNSAYFDSTRLIIDSIVYSPNLNKLAAFVIVENPTDRQLTPDEKHEWYFDATCYLGTRQNDSLSLFWMGPNFSNSPDQKSLSETIRNSYFTEIAHWDSSVRNTPHYNLNDIRFWNDSSIWKQFEDQKRKKIGFEKEKKEHPENVYEPSHSK